MAVKTQSLGPWDGGLNLSSSKDLSAYLGPNELGECLNTQISVEGFLEPRPGCKVLDFPFNTGTPTIDILGSIKALNETIVVVQVQDGVNTSIYYVFGDKTYLLKATFSSSTTFSTVLAVNNNSGTLTDTVPRGVFLFSSSVADGCYRLEEVPSKAAGTVTPVLMNSSLTVPRSNRSFLIKDRVFLVDYLSSTIYWSAVGPNCLFFNTEELDGNSDPTSSALETGYVQLEPSVDPTDILTAAEFKNNTFYLFKSDSTYVFTYQASPEDDGYVRKVNSDLGAFDSTIFRDTIVVVNHEGIYSVEGLQFFDLQGKLDLARETEIDRLTNIKAFITSLGSHLLVGFETDGNLSRYFSMNGYNRAWSEWNYSYHPTDTIASPGSRGKGAQAVDGDGIIVYTTFNGNRLVYTSWSPSTDDLEYHLDSNINTDTSNVEIIRYIPSYKIKTKSAVGDSPLNYKKIYRTYLRLYISDVAGEIYGSFWEMSINYNNYYFTETNPKFVLHLEPGDTGTVVLPDVETVVLRRTYQLPIPQHRMVEFTFELYRPFTKLIDITLENTVLDRPIQQGFYFLLSGIWFNYADKARI